MLFIGEKNEQTKELIAQKTSQYTARLKRIKDSLQKLAPTAHSAVPSFPAFPDVPSATVRPSSLSQSGNNVTNNFPSIPTTLAPIPAIPTSPDLGINRLSVTDHIPIPEYTPGNKFFDDFHI